MNTRRPRPLFTLVEILIASAVLAVIVATLAPLAITIYRNYIVSQTQAEMESQILTAQEWIKRDLQSSARSEFLLWPQYQTTMLEAISLPVLRRPAGSASTPPVDGQGDIQWTHTVVYHLFDTGAGHHQLRRTVFEPRDSSLTQSQRLQQLEDVYSDGDGDTTFNGQNASTQILLDHVRQYSMRSEQGEVDAYADGYHRIQYHSLGTWILDPGYNTYKFEVVGANPQASGRAIGIDQILVSAIGLATDAECLLPTYASVGAIAESQSMADYSGWSNNAELYFPSSQDGNYVTVRIHNDSWVESTFLDDEARLVNAEVTYCPNLGENVCRLIGMVPSWSAPVQSLNNFHHNDETDYNRHNIRVVVSGRETTLGENLAYSGQRAQVKFKAADSGSRSLYIRGAYIMERASGYNGVPGTVRQLNFTSQTGVWTGNSGQDAFVYPGHSATSDFVELPIEPDKDYLVSYYVQTSADNDRAAAWQDADSRTNTYAYQARDDEGNAQAFNIAGEANWDDHFLPHGNLLELDRIVGVEEIVVSYPESGLYTSKIVDTRLNNPDYLRLNWRHAGSANTDIRMLVRAGDQPDLSDAVAWDSALAFTSPGGVNSLAGLGGRYVQWRAELFSEEPHMQTPNLRDVSLLWQGERRAVDVGVAVGRGPNRGIFSLQVNNEEPQPAQLLMDFTLGREIQNRLYTRDLAVGISPRN